MVGSTTQCSTEKGKEGRAVYSHDFERGCMQMTSKDASSVDGLWRHAVLQSTVLSRGNFRFGNLQKQKAFGLQTLATETGPNVCLIEYAPFSSFQGRSLRASAPS